MCGLSIETQGLSDDLLQVAVAPKEAGARPTEPSELICFRPNEFTPIRVHKGIRHADCSLPKSYLLIALIYLLKSVLLSPYLLKSIA